MIPGKPMEVILLDVSFIQKWNPLMRKLELNKIEELSEAIPEKAKVFKPVTMCPCDVSFI
jgi:hypothetical protein